MLKAIFKLIVVLLFWAIPQWSMASHIVGGEMTYKCLGNDRYAIELTVFRDCENGQVPFDSPAYVGAYTGFGAFVGQIIMPFSGVTDTLDLTLTDPCFVVPPNVCIHRYTYRDTVLLPVVRGGYHLAYQRCCRNRIINNIVNPTGTGATYDVIISEASLRACNSSPTFKEWPPFYICLGSPIDYDNSATDIDGDSIVYELCEPFNGAVNGDPAPQVPTAPPYNPIFWSPGFGLNNMLGGGVDPLRIDRLTGRLTGTPTSLGTYVVGVCAREYKNGVVVGLVKRDFQFTVGRCGKPYTAGALVPNVACRNNLSVFHINSSTPSNVNFAWDFGDNGATSTAFSPTHVYSDTGTYTVRLIAGVGTNCPDTTMTQVNIELKGVNIEVPPQGICVGDTTALVARNLLSNYNNITTYSWLVQNGTLISGQGTDSIRITTNSLANVSLIATNNHGCQGDALSFVLVDSSIAAFDTIQMDCNASLITSFDNQSVATFDNYLWIFDTIGTSTDRNGLFTFPDTGVYNVTLISSYQGCPDTISKPVNIRVLGVDLVDNFPSDACSGDTLLLQAINSAANYSRITNYDWRIDKAILTGQGTPQIEVVGDTSFSYSIAVVNDNGCRDSIQGKVDVFVTEALFDSLISQFCVYDLERTFTNQSIITSGDFQWNIGGFLLQTDTNPTFTFPDTGTYQVQLIAGIGSPCVDTFARTIPIQYSGATILGSSVQVVCKGDTAILTASNGLPNQNTIVNYDWAPSANIIRGQGTDSIYVIGTTNMSFTVVGTNDYGCKDTAFAGINTSAQTPTLSTSATPDSIFIGQTSQLTAVSNRPVTFNWTADTTLDNWFVDDPIAKPRQTTTYYVSAMTDQNCGNTDSVTVYIKQPICDNPIVFVPNAFTPDGDGYNDVLTVEGNNIDELTFVIYNRWGQKIFETNDKNIGWDGTFEGKALTPDVYGYYMQCRCVGGGRLQLKGNITLIR
jgi:gliding motility-associated-like protein